MKTRHVVALVIGCLLTLSGLGLLLGGGAIGVMGLAARDDGGWFSVDMNRLSSPGVAVTADDILVELDGPSSLVRWFDLQARLTARATDGSPIFLGVTSQTDLDRYLSGAAHDRITRVDRHGVADYVRSPGAATVAPPVDQQFWDASASGTSSQQLTWTLKSGKWAIAVMNPDGSSDVAVSATAAVRTGAWWPIVLGMLGLGLVLAGLGVGLIVAGVHGRRRGQLPPPSGQLPPPSGQLPPPSGPPRQVPDDRSVGAGSGAGAVPGERQPAGVLHYAGHSALEAPTPDDPVRLDAELQPDLSRGLWLVKWIAVLPHLVVLGFLWIAFGALTVFAWFAILVTGRYPRAVFDFNVGVLRWTWRVSYYAGTGGLGTDRYPAFSLDPVPEDSVHLEIAYPEHLSRGLIFVKWLLLLPHWIFVAIVAGSSGSGWGSSWFESGTTRYDWPGVLALLVLVAGVTLLFTGSYPRALFDLVVGLNRWVYRVIAYGALMTDVYPPFRLDQGGQATAPTLRPRLT